MKQLHRDIVVTGFALFSMFFGAGNVVFPPHLGLTSGPAWVAGFLCYYLADIGLALLALLAVIRHNGASHITNPLGRIPSVLFFSAIVLCIGPLLAIPRTAATTYELAVLPVLPNTSPVWFSILFFVLISLLCFNESSVIDIVGKILTPVLLLGLLILIGKGIFSPIGSVSSEAFSSNVPAVGIEAGYQTMDVMAALVFGVIILNTLHQKAYPDAKTQRRLIAGTCLVAALMLAAVYMGLTYLGATASDTLAPSTSRTSLVVFLVQTLMGGPGIVLFSVIVALACITTAAALVSSAASYFADHFHRRPLYRVFVVLICGFSTAISVLGLDQIVSVSSPILSILYPPALTLIVLSFFDSIQHTLIFRVAACSALFFSTCAVLSEADLIPPFLHVLPFQSLGLGWVFPVLFCISASVVWIKIKSS